MSFQVEIKGLEELKEKFGKTLVDSVAADAIRTGLFMGTEAVKADARENMGRSTVSLTPEQREAAAQVNAIKTGDNQLQVRTGRLQSSIQSGIDGESGVVFTNVEYARIHELGGFTGKGGKVLIPARPYLLPALMKNIKPTLEFIRKEFIGRLKAQGVK